MAGSTITVQDGESSADAAACAAKVLRDGGLVAFPTETVYGIAARADIPSAVARLRQVKGRGDRDAFTVHVGEPGVAADFVPDMPGVGGRMIRRCWPGPVTLIVRVVDPKKSPIARDLDPSAVTALYYDNAIGLRCPADAVAREILCQAGGPVVAASANHAGKQPPRSGSEVEKHFANGFDLLIDTGRTRYAKASTIVRVHESGYEVLRTGVYDKRMIAEAAALRILFVCTGNTCRSPMAEGLARQLLAKRLGCRISNLEDRNIFIESAGTAGGFGGPPAHAVTTMARRGIDIVAHRSTTLSADRIRRADYVFAMTRGHLDAILGMVPEADGRTFLVCKETDVADPVGGTEDNYERCAAQIEQGLGDRLQEVEV